MISAAPSRRPDVEEIGHAELAVQIVDPHAGEIGYREKADVDAEQHKAGFGQRIRDGASLREGHRARNGLAMQSCRAFAKRTSFKQ